MNKFVKKGIKSLKAIKKDAIIYSKDVYNDFAKPVVKAITKKIAKIDFNGIYKESLNTANAAICEAKSFAKKSDKLIKANTKIVEAAIVKTANDKFKKAQKFINKRVPLATAAVVAFTSVNYIKAEKFINNAYPKIEKFVKANYPNVQSWVVTQLPKVEAFLAGQLSARVQKFAA